MITTPDMLPLMALPTWMPGSLRTAGNANSLWHALWTSVSLTYLPVINDVINFSANDPAQWTGQDEAEEDFLSFWTPELSALRRTQHGIETGAQRLERLLTLRTLLTVPFPESERVMGWALTAALGLATRQWVTTGSLHDGLFVPLLEESQNITLTLDATDPAMLIRRMTLGDTNLMIASQSLWRRRPLGLAPPVRYSPWGRASSMPLLDNSLYPKGSGATSDAVKDVRGRGTVSFSFPARQYDGSVRPGLYDPSFAVEVLSSSSPVRVKTPVDAMKLGDADMRVPGGRLPAPRWRQIAPPTFSPSWNVGPRQDAETIAPPFDLDMELSQPAPTAGSVYGTGTAPAGLPSDHPLAPDYA